jgi:glutathione peroxidase
MQSLYKKYHAQGLEMLAFPCNQFGNQEPGTNDEIKAFVKEKGVTFTMMDKIDVNDQDGDQSPVYEFLNPESDIRWNFATIFLVGPDGEVTRHDGVKPFGLEGHIKKLLAQSTPTEL